jgi:peroxiredoxin
LDEQTTQLAKLQVGEDAKSVKLVASTVAEIENLMPWLAECKKEGKEVNVSVFPSINPPAQTYLSTSQA